MAGPTERESAWATATLRRSLALAGSREGRLIGATAAGLYLFAALLVGRMLVFGPTGETGVSTVYLASGQPAWLFPMYVVLAPNAVLELPLFSVAAMVLVSAGIGIGMGVAGVLALRLLRWKKRHLASPTALGSVAGLTPAMIALLTLGACCSTTAAATAGIGVVANATGTTTDNLLLNTWFLAVFQLAVLWVALVAQERLIVVYAALLDPSGSVEPARPWQGPALRALGIGLLRVLLVAGAVTWSLSMVAAWTQVGPASASASEWLGWILVVQLPAIVAGVVALVPSTLPRAAARIGTGVTVTVVRAVVLLGGVLLLFGVPPPLASNGLHGLGNEVLGALGYPASAGGFAVPGLGPLALAGRWILQMVPLGAASLALAIAPTRLLQVLRAPTSVTVPAAPTGSAPASVLYAAPAVPEET